MTGWVAPLPRCPRCRGTLLRERDPYGGWCTCINCGWVKEDGDPVPYNVAFDRAEAVSHGIRKLYNRRQVQ